MRKKLPDCIYKIVRHSRRGVARDARRTQQAIKRASQAAPLLLLLAFCSSANASSLESENPFLPPGYGVVAAEAPPPPPPSNGPISRELEFRGIAQIDGIYQFSVYDKTQQKGFWLRENQLEEGMQVRGYDDESRTIIVSKNGRSERLNLMSAGSAPIPVAASVNVRSPQNNNATNNQRQPVLPPGLQNTNNNNNNTQQVIPRRRVILPQN